MLLKILLVISILLQLVAVIVAISLIKKTKYNFAWMLFSFGLIVLAFSRYGEFHQIIATKELQLPTNLLAWTGVATSFSFALGIFLISFWQKYLTKTERVRKTLERRVLNAVLTTEEKERKRFSKELHDGLGPLLASAKLSLSSLEKRYDERVLKNSIFVIDEAANALREISNNLSPHILQDYGVEKALKTFIEKTSGANTINIKLESRLNNQRFDFNTEVVIYRIVCELIANSIKHSKCSEISIKIENDHAIHVTYCDNGKGFNIDNLEEAGMGISNIRSRINSLKGSIEFCNSNEGCVTKFSIPK